MAPNTPNALKSSTLSPTLGPDATSARTTKVRANRAGTQSRRFMGILRRVVGSSYRPRGRLLRYVPLLYYLRRLNPVRVHGRPGDSLDDVHGRLADVGREGRQRRQRAAR